MIVSVLEVSNERHYKELQKGINTDSFVVLVKRGRKWKEMEGNGRKWKEMERNKGGIPNKGTLFSV